MSITNRSALAVIALLLISPAAADGIINGGGGGGAPTGAAGGGLSGTYPNPSVATNANLTGDVTSVGNATTFTGKVGGALGQIPGTATNDSGSAGSVGQYVSSTVAAGSAVSLTTDTPANITSISLTAGDWDVSAYCIYNGGVTTTVKYADCSISQTTGALDQTPGALGVFGQPTAGTTLFAQTAPTTLPLIPWRISLSGTTTVFLVTQMGFGTSTATAYGIIRARRAR
jgi:hypothetical protein